ncbi:MAG: bifunctional diguanylate cyclase/phosphodiesterase [Nitrospirae bacterium]|nr:MAG: bifunctional diguanylate cyclase/phosphodiesterase [Nitrospirota bacterium]
MAKNGFQNIDTATLKYYIASLEELLRVLDQTSLEQARDLEFRNVSLRESEEKFRAMSDAAQDAVIMADNEGRAMFWNKSAERIFGYSADEAVGKGIHELIIPFQQRERHLAGFAGFRSTGSGPLIGTTTEVPALTKVGAEILVEISLSAVVLNGKWCAIAIVRDVTEHKRAEEEMKKLSAAVERSSDWVLITDRNGAIEYANAAVETISGFTREELRGKTPRILKSGKHDEHFYENLWATLLKGDTFQAIITNRNKSGGLFELFHTITPLKDNAGAITHFISIAKDLTQLQLLEEKVYRLAYYDDLTGLPNRAFQRELLKRTIEYAKRYRQTFGVLFIDLDNFKRINDSLGHDSGDLLLKSVAQRLSETLRKSDHLARARSEEEKDIVARLGGDEFLAILPNLREAQAAARVAGRILKDLASPFDLAGREVFITASVGVSVYPDDGGDIEGLLKNADVAMYRAKDEGKNGYRFYSKSMNAMVSEILTIETEIRKAIDRNEFVMYYQPKLDAHTKAVTGMEALIRWRHPVHGLLMPGRFIPVAETSDLIAKIGEFSLRAACLQMRRWYDAGFRKLSVAVNVSGRQFSQGNLLEVVGGTLAETGLPAECLELEITESTIMRNPDEAVRSLLELKGRGIKIAIDDFGTGYSSLNYLKQLPLDFLKVDYSFVKNLVTSHNDRAIIRAVIALAHSLNLRVIAEGVETPEQSSFLTEQGCDELQGFLFSKAVPAEEFVWLLEKGRL